MLECRSLMLISILHYQIGVHGYTLHASHAQCFSCSVLVHSGGVHGGHYYAYIRPTLSDQWYAYFMESSSVLCSCNIMDIIMHAYVFKTFLVFCNLSKEKAFQNFPIFSFLVTCLCCFRFKFDDERVTKEDVKRALEEQYGGEEEVI